MNPTSTPLSNLAWLVVALLVPVALLNYLDRQMLASMKFSMVADIPGIANEADWGKVLAVFKWTYAFFAPIGGYLADRFSRRHVVAGSLLVWSAITWATGHVQTYEQLVWTRGLMGISEAFYMPAALALIADFHTGSTRSKAVGFHQMGIYVGVIIGGFSGHIADNPSLGWRWVFDCAGIIGILYAIPLFLLLKNPARPIETGTSTRPSPIGALRELMANRSFLLLVMYFTLPALAGWVIRDWGPSILKTEFSISQGSAGVSATLYWQVAAICGAMIGGWLADRRMRVSHRGRINASALGMAIVVPAMLGFGYAPQSGFLWLAIGFLILFGIGYGMFDANNMPILCQVARPGLRATGYGIMNLVSISCGGIADWSFGIMRDHEIPIPIIFGTYAGAAVIALILVLLIRPSQSEPGSVPIPQ